MNAPDYTARPRSPAWVLVLVYLLGIPGLVPAALASLVSASDEHEVHFAFTKGRCGLVLHHDDDHHRHVHGALTRLITGIAAHEDDEDHVLHVATTSDVRSTGNSVLNAPFAIAAFEPCHIVSFRSRCAVKEAVKRPMARPPPLTSVGMLCLRTTVLVL